MSLWPRGLHPDECLQDHFRVQVKSLLFITFEMFSSFLKGQISYVERLLAKNNKCIETKGVGESENIKIPQ